MRKRTKNKKISSEDVVQVIVQRGNPEAGNTIYGGKD